MSKEGVVRPAADSPRLILATRIGSVTIVTAVVAWFAWISDDAFITLRTALNTVAGYGPIYNIDERVQAYTHPLWFAVLLAAGWLTGQWMLMPMLLGIAATAGATGVIVAQVRQVSRIVLLTVALILSNAFVEYATSGLENGLSYLLLAGLVVAAHRLLTSPSLGWAIGAGALTAGVLLNRLDLVLLIAPLGIYVAVQLRRYVTALVAMLVTAAVPLIAWFTFSAIYYGSLLPSTFTAKTNVDIPRAELLVGGVRYLAVTFIHDPVSLLILIAGVILAIVAGGMVTRLAMVGIGLYLLYVVWIGGDFMAGRFIAVPVFVTVAVLATERAGAYVSLLPGITRRQGRTGANAAQRAAVLGIVLLSLPLLLAGWGRSDALTGEPPPGGRWSFLENGGVADERGFYMAFGRGLWQYLGNLRPIESAFYAEDAQRPDEFRNDLVQFQASAAAWPSSVESRDISVRCGGLGEGGLLFGPGNHVVDACGLADVFIASIPYVAQDFTWRAGHFDRGVPAGYLDAILENDPTLVEDEILRERLIRIWERIR